MRYPILWISRLGALFSGLMLCVLLCLPCDAKAAGPQPASAARASAVAADPAREIALKTFLQKRFKLPSIDDIKLGPMTPTPIPGLYARTVDVSNEQGQIAHVTLFVDKDESRFIAGQFYDVDHSDPWGRIDLKALHLDDRPAIGNP
ncbi:MAG TPA: hypothetical protein VIX12_07605, partial [Candidatus Binataceae bacterium]